MVNVYRWLLFLYPTAYRNEFSGEMTLVFCQSEEATRTARLAMRIAFCVRELSGLLSGALREHIRTIVGSYEYIPFTRFDMRPEFRFPRSTVS